MLTVEEARKAVLDHCRPLPPRRVALTEALGCSLAGDVTADIDVPPFDKALVDGYAIRSEDLAGEPPYRLRVVEEIPAGLVPTRSLSSGEAASIMTGAPLPAGADAVVMVEHTRRAGESVVIEPPSPVRPGQNRMERGREMRAGEVVLCDGNALDPVRLGVLASIGCAYPWVRPRPLVRIVPTGDELVAPDEVPGPGQIRNSNAVMLGGLVEHYGAGRAEILPIARDAKALLTESLSEGLRADVLLVTGGVSAGKRDLVPEVLTELGVETVFHKVRLKPGKPLLFGIGPARHGGLPGPLVFGLPGNPVSVLVGFLVFVMPALRVLCGSDPDIDTESDGRSVLAASFAHRGDRPTYHPATRRWSEERGSWIVEPLAWAGSPDLRALAYADGFVIVPAGDHDYSAGDEVGFLTL